MKGLVRILGGLSGLPLSPSSPVRCTGERRPSTAHSLRMPPATVVDAVRDVLQSVTSIRARAPSAETSHVPSSSS
jgi:hypothetical protein